MTWWARLRRWFRAKPLPRDMATADRQRVIRSLQHDFLAHRAKRQYSVHDFEIEETKDPS